jgi:hypothetical protein
MAPKKPAPSAMARPARRSDARKERIRTEILGEGEARVPRVVLYDALHFATGSEGFHVWSRGGGDKDMRAKYGIEEGDAREATGPRPYLIDGRNVPAVLADLKKQSARPAIEKVASELAKICGAEVIDAAVRDTIARLDYEGGVSHASLDGILGRAGIVKYKRLPLEADRYGGEIVFHLYDIVMVATDKSLSGAHKMTTSILQNYYGVGVVGQGPDSSSGSISIVEILSEGPPDGLLVTSFEGQGGRPTLAATIHGAVEFLALLPENDISASVRRGCADAFVRLAGGDHTLVDEVAANHRIQEFLKRNDPDNPLRAAGEAVENRGVKREGGVDSLVRIAKRARAEQRILALRTTRLIERQRLANARLEEQNLAVVAKFDEQHLANARLEEQNLVIAAKFDEQRLAISRLESQNVALLTLLGELRASSDSHRASIETGFASLRDFVASLMAASPIRAVTETISSTLSAAVEAVVPASIRDALALRRRPRRTVPVSFNFPEDQRASPQEAGVLSTPLASVFLEMYPGAPYESWRRFRGAAGRACLAERLRCHRLGVWHELYVDRPLLWTTTGHAGEGGGLRYVYLQAQRALIRRAIKGTVARARRARLTAAEIAVPWPALAADIDP